METKMECWLMKSQIKAAITSQDQLCFAYLSDKNEIVVRFVTPIELDRKNGEKSVLCAQHLPKEGYRRFSLDKIQKFHRVVSRDVFANSEFFAKNKKPKGDGA